MSSVTLTSGNRDVMIYRMGITNLSLFSSSDDRDISCLVYDQRCRLQTFLAVTHFDISFPWADSENLFQIMSEILTSPCTSEVFRAVVIVNSVRFLVLD
jgi:hypothetical protein